MFFFGIIFDLDAVIADTESVQLRAVNLMLQPFGNGLSQREWAVDYVGHPIEEDVSDMRLRFQLDAPLEELSARRRSTYSNLLEEGRAWRHCQGWSACSMKRGHAKFHWALPPARRVRMC